MTASVIDCSHWNTVTDWRAVRASGVVGVMHKATQGGDYKDPTFKLREPSARLAGLLWGRYAFGDGSDVHAQVTNFLDGWSRDEALALDWEDNPASQMTISQAMSFVIEVEHRTGIVPALYAGNTVKEAVATGAYMGPLFRCPLWLAEWAAAPTLPTGWPALWLWQWTNKGTVPGITGDVDMNQFDGTEEELLASWAPTPAAPVIAAVPSVAPMVFGEGSWLVTIKRAV